MHIWRVRQESLMGVSSSPCLAHLPIAAAAQTHRLRIGNPNRNITVPPFSLCKSQGFFHGDDLDILVPQVGGCVGVGGRGWLRVGNSRDVLPGAAGGCVMHGSIRRHLILR